VPTGGSFDLARRDANDAFGDGSEIGMVNVAAAWPGVFFQNAGQIRLPADTVPDISSE